MGSTVFDKSTKKLIFRTYLYIEARGGYFSGINSWGVVPAFGFRFGKFDIQGNFTLAGDKQWGGARLSYYFD